MELRYTAKERQRRKEAQAVIDDKTQPFNVRETAYRTLDRLEAKATRRAKEKAARKGKAAELATFKALFPGDRPELKLVDRLVGSLEHAIRLGLLKSARDPRVDAYWLGLGFTQDELDGPGDPDLQRQLDVMAAMPGDREAGLL
jgi:hypothetical protein